MARTESPDSRSRILAGAARVFARKATSAVKVEDLLAVSRVSRRTFYKFFRRQEDVLAALFEAATEQFAGALIAALEQPGSASARLERSIDAYLAFHRSAGPLMRVLQSEARRPDSQLAARRRQVMTRIAAALARVLRPVQGARVDPLAYEALLVALEGISVWICDESDGGTRALARARRVMLGIALPVLAPAVASSFRDHPFTPCRRCAVRLSRRSKKSS